MFQVTSSSAKLEVFENLCLEVEQKWHILNSGKQHCGGNIFQLSSCLTKSEILEILSLAV